ncbi:D-alanyl-D-alanine carboxypeptidase family protein [Alkalihalobacillus hemicellulosilyticus]|uniref:serine-type D-Ala-D-Ala carboxypeptidase n=1 Tax=Halalkalibacter hemicellulosilyticusJCM 9152 TaxID=1236971 RepID=W4QKV8_9BACI|nr:serine hydrolase [Halalkalibacter hemicellulosilyticus]GAE32760.1 D-alanyl-D-alanine carboxypeptidase [Halalkalibacter hemicellulosilyticusJCM 9152]
MNKVMKKPLMLMIVVAVLISSWVQPNLAEASVDLDAEAAILIDAKSGKVLYQKKIDSLLPIASMTKMMSQYLIFEAVENGEISWDDEVPISDFVRQLSLNKTLSNVSLRQDYSYTVRELYESVTIYSANGSMIALADLIAGSETAFVQRMNEKAEELGFEDYEFVNSTGLNNSSMNGNHPDGTSEDAENLLSARATAKLAYHLINDYPEILETAQIPVMEFDAGPGEIEVMHNWNWMIPGIREDFDQFSYDGIQGLKTGSTSTAGAAFTGVAERGDVQLISVVMRTSDREARFTETRKLLDYGFNQFSQVELFPEGYKPEGDELVEVVSGKENEVSISSTSSLTALIQSGAEELYRAELVLDESQLNENGKLEAPIEAGQQVGTLVLTYDGEGEDEYIYSNASVEVPVVTDQAVEKAGWFTMMMRGIGGFFSGIWTGVADTVSGWFGS